MVAAAVKRILRRPYEPRAFAQRPPCALRVPGRRERLLPFPRGYRRPVNRVGRFGPVLVSAAKNEDGECPSWRSGNESLFVPRAYLWAGLGGIQSSMPVVLGCC
jgi:hypothetical protein